MTVKEEHLAQIRYLRAEVEILRQRLHDTTDTTERDVIWWQIFAFQTEIIARQNHLMEV